MEPITLLDGEPSTYVTSNWLASNMAIVEDRLRGEGREQSGIDECTQRVREDFEDEPYRRLAKNLGAIAHTGPEEEEAP